MQISQGKSDLSLHLGLALVSAAVIVFEIGLTRLFSFLLHYHYTFLVVSGAVFGLGLGAMLVPYLRLRFEAERLPIQLGGLAFVLALVQWLATAVLALAPRGHLALVVGAAAVPFVAAGAFLALVFRARSEQSPTLYFYDLVGAALGTLLVIPSLEQLGAVHTLLFAALLAAIAGGLLAWNGARRLAVGGLVCCVLVSGVQLYRPLLEIDLDALAQAADKPMFRALGNAAQPGKLLETRWSAYARTDLVDRSGDTGLNIYMDGGAGSYMFRFNGDFRRMFFLRREAAFFPYYFGPRQRALILGPGGGADVLYALMTGWQQIEGVEINPQIVDLVRDNGAYNGRIYDLQNVSMHVGDGRNYLERSAARYDLIALPLVYAEAADLVGYALQENYLFTRQAMRAYLDHLEPQGRLAFVVHNHTLMLRLITTLASLWPQPEHLPDHLVIINGTRGDPNAAQAYRPLVLVQKTPYSPAQRKELDATARHLGLQPYFVPGLSERAAVSALRTKGLEEYVATAAQDIAPVTDARPFFYHTSRGLDTKVAALLWVALGVLVLMLGLPALRSAARLATTHAPAPVWLALFVAALGGGFMLVEIHLLQRFGLFLGYPVLTLCVTLFAVLLGGGLGALLSAHLSGLCGPKGVGLSAVVVGGAALVFGVLADFILPAALALEIGSRILVALVLLIPLGALMGVCFPAVLRLAGSRASGQEDGGEIPWLWGVNGVAGICGSVLAVGLSLTWGTDQVLYVGSLVYLIGGMVLWLVGRRTTVLAQRTDEIAFKRPLILLLLVGGVWFVVFSGVAASYWRAAPAADNRPPPPPVVSQVWPPTLPSIP